MAMWNDYEKLARRLDRIANAFERIADALEADHKDEPIIYGDEHNCIMTMFGECSYNKTGCGSCAVVEKVRNALDKYEPKDEPFKTIEYCNYCNHKGCEVCVANSLDEHCVPSNFEEVVKDKPQLKEDRAMKIGDEVHVHGYVDEIRKDVVIIRNKGGYFGTVPEEVLLTDIKCLTDQEFLNKAYKMPNGREAIFHYDRNGVGKITLESMDMLMGELIAYQQCIQSRSFWDSKHCDGCRFYDNCPFNPQEDEDEPQAEDERVKDVVRGFMGIVDSMRNPTKEEMESVNKYLESISKPTGVNIFDMMDEPQTERSE